MVLVHISASLSAGLHPLCFCYGKGTLPTRVQVLIILRTLAYQFLIKLPWPNTLLPIALPTVYLWIVDTFALKRGTWVIEEGTKLGLYLWPGLEIE
jgi:lycopene cyclase domain-containing protein